MNCFLRRCGAVLTLSILGCCHLFGKDDNKITGCVTDETGQAVAKATVVADREEGAVHSWPKSTWKAKTELSGCFQIDRVAFSLFLTLFPMLILCILLMFISMLDSQRLLKMRPPQ